MPLSDHQDGLADWLSEIQVRVEQQLEEVLPPVSLAPEKLHEAMRYAVLKGGKLVLRGDIDTLKGDEKVVEAIFPGDAPSPNGLANDPRVRRVERNGRILRVHVTGDADGVVRTIDALSPRTVDVLDLSLEDIFLGESFFGLGIKLAWEQIFSLPFFPLSGSLLRRTALGSSLGISPSTI